MKGFFPFRRWRKECSNFRPVCRTSEHSSCRIFPGFHPSRGLVVSLGVVLPGRYFFASSPMPGGSVWWKNFDLLVLVPAWNCFRLYDSTVFGRMEHECSWRERGGRAVRARCRSSESETDKSLRFVQNYYRNRVHSVPPSILPPCIIECHRTLVVVGCVDIWMKCPKNAARCWARNVEYISIWSFFLKANRIRFPLHEIWNVSPESLLVSLVVYSTSSFDVQASG